MKTPKEMYDEGWCKDCNYCFRYCVFKNKCKGYEYDEEVEDGAEETVQFLSGPTDEAGVE